MFWIGKVDHEKISLIFGFEFGNDMKWN